MTRYLAAPTAIALITLSAIHSLGQGSLVISNRMSTISSNQLVALAIALRSPDPVIARSASNDLVRMLSEAFDEPHGPGTDEIIEKSKSTVKIRHDYAAFSNHVQHILAEVNSLSQSKPTKRQVESLNPIGEFESDDDYQKRIEITYDKAHSLWQASIDKKASELSTMTNDIMRQYRALQGECQAATYPTVSVFPSTGSLPLFDRQKMTFGPLTISPSSESYRHSLHDKMFLKIRYTGDISFDISAGSLDDAKVFKQLFEERSIRLKISYTLRLIEAESPIMVSEAEYEDTTSVDGTKAALFGIDLLMIALGNNAIYNAKPLDTKRVQTTPARFREGARYYVDAIPVSVELDDTKRHLIPPSIRISDAILTEDGRKRMLGPTTH